jgi:predicted DNA-binding WGR domain protein
MKRHFTYKDEKSDKFWMVEVLGNNMTVVFGKTNTAGVTNTKTFENEADALREAEKLIREKLKKGYLETPGESVGEFSETEFWSLIERSKKNAEDLESQIMMLAEYLQKRSIDDIIAFEHILQGMLAKSYQTNLWGAAYLINGGCSDDGFDYFRGWLIAKGKDVFQNVLANPDNLSKYIHTDDFDFREYECEIMLGVSSMAFEMKTDQSVDAFFEKINRIPYPPIEMDWDFEDDDELKKRLPKLFKKLEG